MPKEKKVSKSFRLSPLVVSLIAAEQQERSRDGGEVPSEADIIEECVFRYAAQNPEFRERIVAELRRDARFAAIADSLHIGPDPYGPHRSSASVAEDKGR